jgi:hypothetical protein
MPDRWQKPRSQHRRLAAARGTDDSQEGCLRQADGEFGNQVVSPEEPLGVLGLERLQAFVRAEPWRWGGVLLFCKLPGRGGGSRGYRGFEAAQGEVNFDAGLS